MLTIDVAFKNNDSHHGAAEVDVDFRIHWPSPARYRLPAKRETANWALPRGSFGGSIGATHRKGETRPDGWV